MDLLNIIPSPHVPKLVKELHHFIGDHVGLAKGKDFFTLKDANPLKSFMMIGEAVWVFPKNRGTPKWMIYNGNPY